MNRFTRFIPFTIAMIAAFVVSFVLTDDVDAVEKAKIDEAIRKAQQYIVRQRLTSPQGTIAALAYVKSGGDKKDAAIIAAEEYVLSKSQSGFYRPTLHHNYEAGVDLMFLEAMNPEIHRLRIEMIVAYLVGTQQPNGAWYYDHGNSPDCGDTSITQYAILGLWAAIRVGVDVPVEVLEKAARWHLAKQKEDGGYAYQPYEGNHGNNPEFVQSTYTMSAAGSSNMLIIRRLLFNDAEMDAEVRPPDVKPRFGVLERFVEGKRPSKPSAKNETTLRPSMIDKSLKESVKWTIAHFAEKGPNKTKWSFYYYYCIERVAALMDIDKLGTHDWYEYGATELLSSQAADGSWVDNTTVLPATAFGLMFLSKATTTVVTPKKKVALLGGGIQIGGRGLPDNLGAVQVKEGGVSARKIVGSVDNLLIELERSADAKVEDVQAAVVEAVQLDRPEDLIGQTARLRKLAVDSRVEVRRTAYWALGRSGDISTAKLLIEGLSDPDISVVREASIGLAILSRRPEGCGKPTDPTDDVQMGIKDDATDDERKAKLKDWRDESKKRWADWYKKIRPYDERDDRTTLKPVLK